jgi:hypothetical protein
VNNLRRFFFFNFKSVDVFQKSHDYQNSSFHHKIKKFTKLYPGHLNSQGVCEMQPGTQSLHIPLTGKAKTSPGRLPTPPFSPALINTRTILHALPQKKFLNLTKIQLSNVNPCTAALNQTDFLAYHHFKNNC